MTDLLRMNVTVNANSISVVLPHQFLPTIPVINGVTRHHHNTNYQRNNANTIDRFKKRKKISSFSRMTRSFYFKTVFK